MKLFMDAHRGGQGGHLPPPPSPLGRPKQYGFFYFSERKIMFLSIFWQTACFALPGNFALSLKKVLGRPWRHFRNDPSEV